MANHDEYFMDDGIVDLVQSADGTWNTPETAAKKDPLYNSNTGKPLTRAEIEANKQNAKDRSNAAEKRKEQAKKDHPIQNMLREGDGSSTGFQGSAGDSDEQLVEMYKNKPSALTGFQREYAASIIAKESAEKDLRHANNTEKVIQAKELESNLNKPVNNLDNYLGNISNMSTEELIRERNDLRDHPGDDFAGLNGMMQQQLQDEINKRYREGKITADGKPVSQTKPSTPANGNKKPIDSFSDAVNTEISNMGSIAVDKNQDATKDLGANKNQITGLQEQREKQDEGLEGYDITQMPGASNTTVGTDNASTQGPGTIGQANPTPSTMEEGYGADAFDPVTGLRKDTEDVGIGKYDVNKTDYNQDEWNQGMGQESNDVVSDKNMKVFLRSCKRDPVLKKAVIKISKYH